MTKTSTARRRPAVHITLQRAARLYRLVRFLATPRSRNLILSELRLGLRTFYRELELLKRCGIKVHFRTKIYVLAASAEPAEGQLPFPDPQLSFSEMTELAQLPGPAAKRLAELLNSVVEPPAENDRRKAGKSEKTGRTKSSARKK
jgi:hypothetical protein